MQPYGPFLRRGDHIVVVGLQGTGKTTFVQNMVSGARRAVFFDPKEEYTRNGEAIKPIDLENEDLFKESRLRLAVQAGKDPNVDIADEFKYVVRRLREMKMYGGEVFVADEINLYSAKAGNIMRMLMANGHKDGIVDILISQRGVDIPLGCRALATAAYSFRQKHKKDLKRLEDEFGTEFAERARTWQSYEPPASWEQERFYE